MKKIAGACFFFSCILYAQAQGCSDAGFCTLGQIHSDAVIRQSGSTTNRFSVGGTFGLADDAHTVFTPYLIYNRSLGATVLLTSKLTAVAVDGPKGHYFGFGDWYNAINLLLNPRQRERPLTLIAGIKIPLTNSDATYQGRALPLSYQSSLGTFDGIVGLKYARKGLELSVALQYPFTNRNENTFFAIGDDAATFSSTNAFHRQPDVLLRVAYNYRTRNEKWSFVAGLLPIYHLGNDSYINNRGRSNSIEHSVGGTLNGLATAAFFIRPQHYVEFSVAAPFVVREIRPDGLTRAFVAGLEYNFLF